MEIRPIELKDAEHYLLLNKRIDESGFMLHEPGEKQLTITQQQAFIERVIQTKSTALFVADDGEDLVGFILAIGGTVRRNRHSAYIVVGIDEAYRGQGLATKLFEEIFVWARDMKISRLELTVIKENKKAYDLYRQLGFSVEGEKIHSLMVDGRPINEYYMYKLVE
ncbi:GNAT family N-acetyltransferase [Alkalihalobacillus sp. LMS6]|uniref:GNAT family N-acetyltransferase n=1 Tax=Bacillaceae TaxID=186817 RepID=UPI000C08B92A|nr:MULTISPECIES: GNAT family N-acetyltransferase [Bacillaceae]UTR05926.1 GNAT family N-acetyltransferase [Alkalihalobacillus sp. LMS6]